jgi:hypothetical protein
LYLTTHSPAFSAGYPAFGEATLPALCSADQPVDSGAAMLFSDLAPLASLASASKCDHKAVWAFVPQQRPSLSVHVYLHGNNNLVTVDALHPGGRHADWAGRHRPSSLRPKGPFASGPKYEMDLAAQSSAQRPVVLAPEDAVAPGPQSKFWAVGARGAFEGDSNRLGAMIDDCLARLRRLPSPSGSPYLQGPASALRRLYLSGHSGGGVPLSVCAGSTVARQVPTDLWLYDCTYWASHVSHYVAFAQAWAQNGRLGNGPGQSRLVILVTGDPKTTSNAVAIVRGLEHALNTHRVRLTRQSPAVSGTILEAMPDATVASILSALRTFPVSLIHTRITHDQIPRVWTPRLLNTAR